MQEFLLHYELIEMMQLFEKEDNKCSKTKVNIITMFDIAPSITAVFASLLPYFSLIKSVAKYIPEYIMAPILTVKVCPKRFRSLTFPP